jgi:hypothetical protein
MRRWLYRFGPRLQDQLNIVAGIVGVGAVALGAAGLFTEGTVRTVLILLGAGIVCIMVVVGIIRAWPPKELKPSDVAGEDHPLADLPSIYPRVPALGVLGAGAVGKSTLKSRLLQLPAPEKAYTQNVTFHVSALLHNHQTYVALLDGRGESYDQQFEIAAQADIVLILLDHNDIDSTDPNADRLAAHRDFGNQIRDYLNRRAIRKRVVHLLLNKTDLWHKADDVSQEEIRSFFAEEVERWRSAFGGDAVTEAEHSNDLPDDTADLIQLINSRWAEIKSQPQ